MNERRLAWRREPARSRARPRAILGLGADEFKPGQSVGTFGGRERPTRTSPSDPARLPFAATRHVPPTGRRGPSDSDRDLGAPRNMIERDSSGVALRHGESERVRPCSGRFCRFRPERGEERPPATRSLFLLRVGHSSRSAKFMSASRDGATLPGELAEVGTRQHRVRVRKAFGGGARGRSRHLVCLVAAVGTT